MTPALRAILLGALSLLTAAGVLPQDVHDAIHANADAVVSGILATWAIVATIRARKERAAP